MEDSKFPLFVMLTVTAEPQGAPEELLINLSQVRMVDQITNDTARLVFSEKFTFTLQGEQDVARLLGLLGKYSVATDGRPLAEVFSISGPNTPPTRQ